MNIKECAQKLLDGFYIGFEDEAGIDYFLKYVKDNYGLSFRYSTAKDMWREYGKNLVIIKSSYDEGKLLKAGRAERERKTLNVYTFTRKNSNINSW